MSHAHKGGCGELVDTDPPTQQATEPLIQKQIGTKFSSGAFGADPNTSKMTHPRGEQVHEATDTQLRNAPVSQAKRSSLNPVAIGSQEMTCRGAPYLLCCPYLTHWTHGGQRGAGGIDTHPSSISEMLTHPAPPHLP